MSRASWALITLCLSGCFGRPGIEHTVDPTRFENVPRALRVDADPGSCEELLAAEDIETMAVFAAGDIGWSVVRARHGDQRRFEALPERTLTLKVRCRRFEERVSLGNKSHGSRVWRIYTNDVPHFELTGTIETATGEVIFESVYKGRGRYEFSQAADTLWVEPAHELVLEGLRRMLDPLPRRQVERLAARRARARFPVVVVADQDFRERYGDGWRGLARTIVNQGSMYLEHHFGTPLEVVDVRSWDTKHRRSTLSRQLHELIETVEARPRQIVIGLAYETTRDLSESTIGIARVFGQHCVVSAGSTTNPTTRGGLRRIGQVVAHEISHVLGAPHVAWGDALMAPMAGELAPRPDPVLEAIVELALEAPPGTTPTAEHARRALAAYRAHKTLGVHGGLALYAARAKAAVEARELVAEMLKAEPGEISAWNLAAEVYELIEGAESPVYKEYEKARDTALSTWTACMKPCIDTAETKGGRRQFVRQCMERCEEEVASAVKLPGATAGGS